jgi:pimeloyl-ACP methyl ester carboxylesterase
MAERFVKVGDWRLWTEDFGQPGDPAILLIHGAGTQGIWWDEELCGRLVDCGRHVIRYDLRDAGESTTRAYDVPYDLEDLATDATGVLDAYGVDDAHVVGVSVGGMIALYTAIYTSPVLRETIEAFVLGQDVSCDLPLARPADYPDLSKVMAEAELNPPTTREDHVEALLTALRIGSGSQYTLDEKHWRSIVERSYDRAQNWDLRNNTYSAILASSHDVRPRLLDLSMPVLAISGSDDMVCKPEHGEAIASTAPHGTYVLVEGTGHSIHPAVYPIWQSAIAKHTI